MKFGLVANLKRFGAKEAIEFFINWAKTSGNQLYLSEDLKDDFQNTINYLPSEELAAKVDILVSMGGDGTLLATARMVGKAGTPILGINLGSLGFMTQLTPQQLLPALDSIVKKEYQIEKRMMLKIDTPGIEDVESKYALNDVVIDNGSVARVININLSVNAENIVTYKADGLIIATPTGSTAYSLAVGGPIMHPKMEAMIASPVSSFSLNTRPMIFSPEDVLEVSIIDDDRIAQVTIDGQVNLPLDSSNIVTITRASFYTQFITFPNTSFYRVLRNKLHWGYTPSEE
ncbi:MAG: NAD(+)/NADH kinase [Calditrichaeota bacterium]|nr:MAG: NAD(+)/NADH kinase [Calditrichota bacterium]